MAASLHGRCGLRHGLVEDIVRASGIPIPKPGKKSSIRCPFHADKQPSAFIDPATNALYCSVCTPGGGWSAKRLAEALGLGWPPLDILEQPEQVQQRTEVLKPDQTFSPAHARETWQRALARARDDDRVDEDRQVYGFVHRRGLGESWEDGLFGVLSTDMDLPASISRWPSNGYRLIAPLYDATGEITNLQARSIGNGSPKTLFPSGSKAAGALFASASGLEVLRQSRNGPKLMILGEGFTDFLALAAVAPAPVLCAPGTSMAASGVGAWIEGYEVLLALDCDEAGTNAINPTAERAYEYGAVRVRRVEWPGLAKDACDVVERVGLEGLAEFVTEMLGMRSP